MIQEATHILVGIMSCLHIYPLYPLTFTFTNSIILHADPKASSRLFEQPKAKSTKTAISGPQFIIKRLLFPHFRKSYFNRQLIHLPKKKKKLHKLSIPSLINFGATNKISPYLLNECEMIYFKTILSRCYRGSL